MSTYYNEIEPYAAQWLRNLSAAGLIPAGDVDERSIADVRQSDVAGYTQCHFFAGLGGWPLAARLAGWPDSRPLWTGSCPCQSFSSAGKRKGTSDERHLWPEFHRLISGVRPPIIVGEQVADAAGRGWLDGVCSDMEAEEYAVRPVILPACCVSAPHERNRIFFVADTDRSYSHRWTNQPGRQAEGRVATDWSRKNARPWDGTIWTADHRGINRRTPSGVHLLANGLPNRMEQLRAYANAIVAELGAEVLAAYLDCVPETVT